MLDLAALLNPEQHRAATTTEGPLLVLAGAGSGKTRVLVHRIAHIVESGLAEPWQILAVTFTNKAAQEMRNRLIDLLGPDMRRAWIGTFHSMCGRVLRREGHRLGYDANFTIYDSDDARRAIKQTMQVLKMDASGRGPFSANAIAGAIDRAKNKGLGPKAYLDAAPLFSSPAALAAKKVYPRYQDTLRRANAMDFGDLLLLAVELLEHHPEVQTRLGRRFRYVLVDEFQDTNAVQMAFLKALLSEHQNIAVVGDDDQSIYRWRGAEVRNILDFPKLFGKTTVVKLEQNYRSSANILDAANSVIAQNSKRHPKRLWTDAEAGLPIGVALLEDGDDEAVLVAEVIASRVERGERPDDFAILYRQNAQSRLFEMALRRKRVPFVLIGSTAFFERREVKDIISYLRVIANPKSMADFERIVNVPPRKVGDRTLERLREAGAAGGVSGAEVLDLDEEALTAVGIKGAALKALKALGATLRGLREMSVQEPATDVAQATIEQIRYVAYLEASEPATAEDRIANVGELVTSISEHETMDLGDDGIGLAGARTPLQAFLDEAALTSASDRNLETGSVSMLTLHAAKGLEFPVVFLVGLEEHTFPGRRAIEGEPEDMEEERRLCYVGITRAKQELNLLAARHRRIYGMDEIRRPSRFLADIPDTVVQNLGGGEKPRRHVFRGADRIEYDEAPPPVDHYEPPTAETALLSPQVKKGARVHHNTFGEGVVEAVDGSGPKAHLTIRFHDVGRKRVVAKYVCPADD